MKQILYFLAAAIGGLLLHQTASVTHKMPKGWQQLAGTAIGVEGTFPFFVLFLRRMGLHKDKIFMISLAYQAVFLAVGCGVALGWVLDTLFNVDREKSEDRQLPNP
jgi:uncharacterized membrane protein AbrB (regulator of aidB expression)